MYFEGVEYKTNLKELENLNSQAYFDLLLSLGEMTKTTTPSQELISRDWYLINAENQTLGRLASEIATILRGKNKPTYTPHIDTGDFVIIINAEKISVTGKKAEQKLYRRHSGRPGGMKVENFSSLQSRIPERIIEKAVKGMLPHNSLGRQLFRKLKVYKGSEHPHSAQNPKPINFNLVGASK